MTPRLARGLLVVLVAIVSIVLKPAANADAVDEQLWQHRNLGKAFYENPTTQYEAVEQFRQALALAPTSVRERLNYGLALLRAGKTDDGIAEIETVQRQAPRLPHTWFNLGIQYKKRATPEANQRAIEQFERMATLVPDEPITRYNLGYLYKVSGRAGDALKQFEAAARLDPNLAGPHFQLYNGYRDPQVGRADDAARELATFQAIKKRQAGAIIPEDLDWSIYSEIFDPIDQVEADADPAPIAPSFDRRAVLRGLDAETSGLVVVDSDGGPGVIAWSSKGVRLIVGGARPIEAGLEQLTGVVTVAPGDFDNDGATDLAVITTAGATLWRNAGGEHFVNSGIPLPAGTFTQAFWLDYDHDYDLDLVLLGPRSYLLRNAGAAGFGDVSAEFPFVQGTATDAVPFQSGDDTIGHDVVVSYADRAGVLYRDRLAGKYDALPIEALAGGSRALLAQDIDRDGWLDLVVSGPGSTTLLVGRAGRLELASTLSAARGVSVADFENRGVVDLIAGDRIFRWTPGGFRDTAIDLPESMVRLSADLDGDGRTDVLSVDRSGVLRLYTNVTKTAHRWLAVKLTGVKNLKTAIGAKVEVKAGSRYQKQLYTGAPLHFGLGTHEIVDTVRITWPNGLIQNETRQAVSRTAFFTEAPRLSGSCPMIFTWDGARFRFITDVLGVAPLGASAGDGQYFPVDHDEYVYLPGEALAPIDGRYEVRVTEELREVSYLDRIQLIALDHPSSIAIVTNDKFKSPPFPEFRLFGVETAVAPVAARDERGFDVRDRLSAVDQRYPDGFRRDYEGVAETHALDLDFGSAAPDNRAVLVLTGWVDWADGSTFRGASQESAQGLVLPYLQVKDETGRWQTVIEDMGIPAGKPKTIVVDLSGKFLSASRIVRIVTNLCVYWDRIYLSERTDAPSTVLTPVNASAAELRFRGFSRPVIDPERRQPETFDYHDVRTLSMWNPTPGLYTRYGDVRSLL